MSSLTFTLLADGSSDRVLLRHLNWLFTQHVNPETMLREQWADLRGLPPQRRNLSERIQTALEYYPCNILFIHRDAESASVEERSSEILDAVGTLNLPASIGIVPVIPVRMQETWLLFDIGAIRSAAGNPNGNDALNLPSINDLENIPDPKSLLYQSLKLASGLTGRRLKKFSCHHAAVRVADYVDDFAPLRQVLSFARLEAALNDELGRLGLA